MVDLLPGSYAYCDIYREAPPVLVIDTGPAEVQFSFPVDRVTLEDLRVIDSNLEGWAAFRTAMLAWLD
jgi:hypothetical protein